MLKLGTLADGKQFALPLDAATQAIGMLARPGGGMDWAKDCGGDAVTNNELEITFRRIDDNMPSDWSPGCHWYVEAWPTKFDCAAPYGTAYVFVCGDFIVLEYLLVRDDCRRSGVATALVSACKERWPGCGLTDAVSDSGEALIRSLPSRGLAK